MLEVYENDSYYSHSRGIIPIPILAIRSPTRHFGFHFPFFPISVTAHCDVFDFLLLCKSTFLHTQTRSISFPW